MAEHRDDPKTYPALGRLMTWVDRPGSAGKLFYGLAALCALLFALDFTYEKHGHFAAEDYPGFYGIYGFVMFTALILLAKGLRVLVKRDEGFYDPYAVDTEDYPEEQLERVDNDG